MNIRLERRPRMEDNKKTIYNHYFAVDWSQNGVAIANMTSYSEEPRVQEINSNIRLLKNIVNNHKGSKILAVEETTGSHWIYVELKDCVDKVLICDPRRNRLLSEGHKNDKIDARKLCILLRNGLLKEVYHSLEEDYHLRKLVSAYEDLVKAGVRVMSQRSAIYRSEGLRYKKDTINNSKRYSPFIESQQLRSIAHYKEEKKMYIKLFLEIKKNREVIKYLTGIPGIKVTTAMKIYATVIDASRFENKYKYWGYCGLTYHLKESGGRIYGKKRPRYSRILKSAYKTAAVAAIRGKNDIREYFEHMLKEGISVKEAKNQIARYIAKVSYAVMKNKMAYKAYQWRDNKV
jgi:transposase